MAASPPLVALIGFMGCGKSTVGALLASRLGYRFLDLDELVEKRAGRSIRQIFEADGEEAFRDLESLTLQSLPAPDGGSGLVLAAGGGAPLRPENRRWFRERATTFFLEISFRTFLRRTGADPARPLLRRGGAELRRLFDSRLSAYREAGRPVDADSRAPPQVADEILKLLEGGSRGP